MQLPVRTLAFVVAALACAEGKTVRFFRKPTSHALANVVFASQASTSSSGDGTCPAQSDGFTCTGWMGSIVMTYKDFLNQENTKVYINGVHFACRACTDSDKATDASMCGGHCTSLSNCPQTCGLCTGPATAPPPTTTPAPTTPSVCPSDQCLGSCQSFTCVGYNCINDPSGFHNWMDNTGTPMCLSADDELCGVADHSFCDGECKCPTACQHACGRCPSGSSGGAFFLSQRTSARTGTTNMGDALSRPQPAVLRRQSDSWRERPVSRSPKLRQHSLISSKSTKQFDLATHGAATVPYVTAFKDGYNEIGCLKDAMRARNGSVWYDKTVPKEDQMLMTPEVCFNFCRTVPDAGSFGLHAGRDCYCTPYFQAEPDDSSDCDSSCEGSHIHMCGGKTKQSIYVMHTCSRTAENLQVAMQSATDTVMLCVAMNVSATSLNDALLTLGHDMKDRGGARGDSITAGYGQLAVSSSGKVAEAIRRTSVKVGSLSDHVAYMSTLMGLQFSDFSESRKAEKAIADAKSLVSSAREICEHWPGSAMEKSDGKPHTHKGGTYYPVTYWLKSAPKTVNLTDALPSTCEGAPLGDPLIVAHVAQCSAACSNHIWPKKCIAFEFYESGVSPYKICIMLTSIEAVGYYKGGACNSTNSVDGVICAGGFSSMTGFEHRVNTITQYSDHVPVHVHGDCF